MQNMVAVHIITQPKNQRIKTALTFVRAIVVH